MDTIPLHRNECVFGLLALSLMALSGRAVSGLEAAIQPAAPNQALEVHESHASASLLGQFRTSVSAWLWVRTDLYLHNGVEMRPMTDWERRQGRETHEAAHDGHERLHDESHVTTVVPAAEYDFRGLFGHIEREITAYKDMRGHDHNDPKSALPLFRLMTWLDPHFIQGWTVGASVIARDRDERSTAAAIAFLQSGLEQNPGNIAILTDLAQVHITRRKDYRRAIPILEKAVELHRRRNRLPKGEEEPLLRAYRWLGLCHRNLGNTADMRRVAEEGLSQFPDDAVLDRMLSAPPSVLMDRNLERVIEPVERECHDPSHHHGPLWEPHSP
ncbi:MAG TPA: tetratricopeptide repeat protein [Fimbriimonadaceae bacterium]|nr:tetratricopeptide repeat protein [Fimbriimonadaceae bacterium]